MASQFQIGVIAAATDLRPLINCLSLSDFGLEDTDTLDLSARVKFVPCVAGSSTAMMTIAKADAIIIGANIISFEDSKAVKNNLRVMEQIRPRDAEQVLLAVVLWGENAERIPSIHPKAIIAETSALDQPPAGALLARVRAAVGLQPRPTNEPTKLRQQEEELAQEKARAGELAAQLEASQQCSAEIEKEIAQLQKQLADIQNSHESELAALHSAHHIALSTVTIATEALLAMTEQQAAQQITGLRTQHEELQARLATLEDARQTATQNNENLTAELRAIEARLEEQKEQNQKLIQSFTQELTGLQAAHLKELQECRAEFAAAQATQEQESIAQIAAATAAFQQEKAELLTLQTAQIEQAVQEVKTELVVQFNAEQALFETAFATRQQQLHETFAGERAQLAQAHDEERERLTAEHVQLRQAHDDEIERLKAEMTAQQVQQEHALTQAQATFASAQATLAAAAEVELQRVQAEAAATLQQAQEEFARTQIQQEENHAKQIEQIQQTIKAELTAQFTTEQTQSAQAHDEELQRVKAELAQAHEEELQRVKAELAQAHEEELQRVKAEFAAQLTQQETEFKEQLQETETRFAATQKRQQTEHETALAQAQATFASTQTRLEAEAAEQVEQVRAALTAELTMRFAAEQAQRETTHTTTQQQLHENFAAERAQLTQAHQEECERLTAERAQLTQAHDEELHRITAEMIAQQTQQAAEQAVRLQKIEAESLQQIETQAQEFAAQSDAFAQSLSQTDALLQTALVKGLAIEQEFAAYQQEFVQQELAWQTRQHEADERARLAEESVRDALQMVEQKTRQMEETLQLLGQEQERVVAAEASAAELQQKLMLMELAARDVIRERDEAKAEAERALQQQKHLQAELETAQIWVEEVRQDLGKISGLEAKITKDAQLLNNYQAQLEERDAALAQTRADQKILAAITQKMAAENSELSIAMDLLIQELNQARDVASAAWTERQQFLEENRLLANQLATVSDQLNLHIGVHAEVKTWRTENLVLAQKVREAQARIIQIETGIYDATEVQAENLELHKEILTLQTKLQEIRVQTEESETAKSESIVLARENATLLQKYEQTLEHTEIVEGQLAKMAIHLRQMLALSRYFFNKTSLGSLVEASVLTPPKMDVAVGQEMAASTPLQLSPPLETEHEKLAAAQTSTDC